MFRISGAGLYFNNCLLFDYWCDFCNFRRRNRQIKEALTIYYSLIIGMTRSGKGEMFVRTVIDIAARSEEKPSLIIPDLKLELSSSSYSALKEAGYIPLIFNVEDPSTEVCRTY